MATHPTSRRALNADELRNLIGCGRITTVVLAVVDPQGRLKGKEFDARFFLDRFVDDNQNAEACGYLFATDIDMTPDADLPLASWNTGFGDVHLSPDTGLIRVLPWLPRTALVFADPLTQAGDYLDVAPTALLQRELTLLGELGMTCQLALESEFTLYHGTLEQQAALGFTAPQPVSGHNRDYSLDQPRVLSGYTRALRAAMAGAGLPVEAVKGESAPGQVEITFPHGEPLAVCERHILMQHAARTLAERRGLTAAFMAAPAPGVGNGLHLHLNLWTDPAKGEAAQPLFPPDAYGVPLSATGRHAVAGLLELLPDLAPLYAPTVNSYKRYSDRSFAPTRMTWGVDNRTCAVRVTGHGPSLRLEIRVPGVDANPFLAATAALAAIRYGITKHLELPAPIGGNAYRHTDARRLPRSLDQALDGFEVSEVARDLLGDQVHAHYLQLGRLDADFHAAQVTDVERRRGLRT